MISIHEDEATMQVEFDADECPRCGATLCDNLCPSCAKRKIRALEAVRVCKERNKDAGKLAKDVFKGK